MRVWMSALMAVKSVGSSSTFEWAIATMSANLAAWLGVRSTSKWNVIDVRSAE
jgi:hypothetical protein